MLRGVRTLLHENGYTIKGVQRLHKEHGVRHLVDAASSNPIEINGLVEAPDLGATVAAPCLDRRPARG